MTGRIACAALSGIFNRRRLSRADDNLFNGISTLASVRTFHFRLCVSRFLSSGVLGFVIACDPVVPLHSIKT